MKEYQSNPFTWKIYDHHKKKFKQETVFFTTIPFNFQSLINSLPYRRDTLEEAIMDDYRF